MSGFSKKENSDNGQAQGPGPALGAARQAKGLDLQKTAKMLHLTVETVQHLESNSYQHLPARVFIRGYLRNYARLVDLSEGKILDVFDQSCPDQECAQALPNVSKGIKKEVASNHAIVRVVTWILILGLAISLIISFQDDIVDLWKKLQTVGSGSSAQQEDTSAGDLLIPILEEKTVVAVTEDVSVEESSSVTEIQPSNPPRNFVIHFTGPVWVDIRDDAKEFRITGDMTPGDSKSLQGSPPFTLMVSDYKQVAITIDDQPYDLSPHLQNPGADDELHLQFVLP